MGGRNEKRKIERLAKMPAFFVPTPSLPPKTPCGVGTFLSMKKRVSRDKLIKSLLLAGAMLEGECEPDCTNYHGGDADMIAKEINRAEDSAPKNGGQNAK